MKLVGCKPPAAMGRPTLIRAEESSRSYSLMADSTRGAQLLMCNAARLAVASLLKVRLTDWSAVVVQSSLLISLRKFPSLERVAFRAAAVAVVAAI